MMRARPRTGSELHALATPFFTAGFGHSLGVVRKCSVWSLAICPNPILNRFGGPDFY
jgi:hypothetical protein